MESVWREDYNKKASGNTFTNVANDQIKEKSNYMLEILHVKSPQTRKEKGFIPSVNFIGSGSGTTGAFQKGTDEVAFKDAKTEGLQILQRLLKADEKLQQVKDQINNTPCGFCDGTGKINEDTCDKCDGTGMLANSKVKLID